MNYYELLEIDINASNRDIAKAYRKKALLYHPDKAGSENEKLAETFLLLNTAYEVLSDKEKRAAHDKEIKAELAVKAHREAEEPLRKKRREDLERREKTASSVNREAAFEAQLDKLRRDGLSLVRNYQLERLDALSKTKRPTTLPSYLVKLKWKRKKYTYFEADIRRIFEPFGKITSLTANNESGKAYVAFKNADSIERLFNDDECDELLNFLITRVSQEAADSPLLRAFLNSSEVGNFESLESTIESNFVDSWVSPHANMDFDSYRLFILNLLATKHE